MNAKRYCDARLTRMLKKAAQRSTTVKWVADAGAYYYYCSWVRYHTCTWYEVFIEGSHIVYETKNGFSFLLKFGFTNWEDGGITRGGALAQDSLSLGMLLSIS